MRRHGLARYWLLLTVVFVAACDNRVTEYKRSLFVFGTLVDITIVGADPANSIEAVKAIDRQFQTMHKNWHAWKPGGELHQLNQNLANGKITTLSDSLLPLVTQSIALYEQSDGLFNPAIGQLIGSWGFHSDELPDGPPPDETTLQAYLTHLPSMKSLKITDHQITTTNTHVQLDLGGFAKGYALNVATRILKESGIDHAIVNAGGDLCVIGQRGQRPWRIGIRHPQGEGVIASVEAHDGECVLTSGNYERYRLHDGKRYPHILDPRTGMPVNHVASVTVIDRNGGKADAAATALTIAGTDDWHRIAQRMSLHYVMLVDEAGQVYLNPAMQARVMFEAEQAHQPQISSPLLDLKVSVEKVAEKLLLDQPLK